MIRWSAVRKVGLAAALVCTIAGGMPTYASAQDHPKLDKVLNKRASQAVKRDEKISVIKI